MISIIYSRLVSAITKLDINCNRVHEHYAQLFQNCDGVYFRFNLNRGPENVSLKEWKKMNILSDHVEVYLDHREARKHVESVVELLSRLATWCKPWISQ